MFGNLAEMAKLMGKAKEIQTGVKKFKEEMATMEFSATSVNGWVKVTVYGDFRIKSIEFSAEANLNSTELADAVTSATNNALNAVKVALQTKMQELTGGIGMDLSSFC